MKPVLMPGNEVEAMLSSRNEAQLAQGSVELVHSRGPLLQEPLPAAAVDWVCALVATALPEGQPYPASGWGAALVRFELLLLAELGFGLDLGQCAVSGATEELVAVSPRSGRAVGRAAAEPYAGKLLPLPSFILEGGQASWPEILEGLELSGHFLLRDLITDRSAPVGLARSRLVLRLRKAGGQA